jgi:hypothetical protein
MTFVVAVSIGVLGVTVGFMIGRAFAAIHRKPEPATDWEKPWRDWSLEYKPVRPSLLGKRWKYGW